MDIKELQIGNWLMHNGKAKQIVEVDARGDSVIFSDDWTISVDLSHCQPIELTEELLNKNLIQRLDDWQITSAWYVKQFVDGKYQIGTFNDAYSTPSFTFEFRTTYVHQLQNTLKFIAPAKTIVIP